MQHLGTQAQAKSLVSKDQLDPISAAVALKANKASDTFTGNVGFGGQTPPEQAVDVRSGAIVRIRGQAGYADYRRATTAGGAGCYINSGSDVNTVFDVDATDLPTGVASIRFFRNTNGTGIKYLTLYRGDGTSTNDHNLITGVAGVSTIARYGALVVGGTTKTEAAATLQVIGPLATTGPIKPAQYTLTTLPSAATYAGYYITVTNATDGPALCYSNGTNWINIRTNAQVT